MLNRAAIQEKIQELLTRNVVEVIDKENLEKKLFQGKRLCIKFGVDPTSSELHLGHAVILLKLKAFQELGHVIIFIIGDFTGRIGDPSSRNEARSPLSEKAVRKNMKRYLKQVAKILDIKKTKVYYNSSWYETPKSSRLFPDILFRVSVQRVLEREDFQKRLKENREITMLELLYPLLQGYDSVRVAADIEIGGTDQKFNMLMGRRLQRSYHTQEQFIVTTQLLPGLDGTRKMSKSFGNTINIEESPKEMFGKIMSLPDNVMEQYFKACTGLSLSEIETDFNGLLKKKIHPKNLKIKLASEIIHMYHGIKEAKNAEAYFKQVFEKKELPQKDIPILKINFKSDQNKKLFYALKQHSIVKSFSEAVRLAKDGAIKIDDVAVSGEYTLTATDSSKIIKIGKHRFFKIVIQS